jgi:hypothetical protein
LACLVVFKLTANPAYAIVVGCLKFGLDDHLLALRVRRRHPDRTTGRVLAMWLTAFGLWKTSGATMAFMLAAAAVHRAGAPAVGAGAIDKHVVIYYVTGVATWWAAVFLSGLYSTWATLAAWRAGTRVWIGKHVNWAKWILFTSGLFTLFAVAMLVFLTLGSILFVVAGLGRSEAARAVAIYICSLASVITPAVLFLILSDRLKQRVLAANPAECWARYWASEADQNRLARDGEISVK